MLSHPDLLHLGGHLKHPVQLHGVRLDFAEFDAEAAKLHLHVDTGDIL